MPSSTRSFSLLRKPEESKFYLSDRNFILQVSREATSPQPDLPSKIHMVMKESKEDLNVCHRNMDSSSLNALFIVQLYQLDGC